MNILIKEVNFFLDKKFYLIYYKKEKKERLG